MTTIAEAAAPILSRVPPRRNAAETGGLDLAVVAASGPDRLRCRVGGRQRARYFHPVCTRYRRGKLV